MSFIVNVYSVLFACPGLGCYLWGLIKNRTQLFGGTGVDGFQPPTSFFPFRPAKTVFENIEFPFDVKDSIMLLLVLLCLLCTVYTMFRVRKVPFREVGWTPALGADNAEWHGKWEDISQYLEKFSPPMIWKFTPEQLQDPVSMIRLVKEKCSGSSRDGQLTATCWALATAYRALLDMIQHCQGEERRTKSADTTSTQTTAESEGERNEPTSTVSTQTIEEPEEQAKPIAVAPVQKRKSKTKSVRIANDDEEAGPSHPPEETEPEIITRSLSLGELRELRREFTRQANESILTWLLRIWDAAANDTILDGSEARQLGSLSRDVVIDQGIGRRQETLSLWRRLLSSVRERYLCKEDLHVQQGQWNTMEQGIRCNGLLKTTLKALCGETLKHWELHLAKATWLVNTRGSINRAGPAQSELLHTVDGDKVPVVHMRGMLGKTVWISPTSSKGKPIRGIVFAQGPGSTWWVMQKDGETRCVPQGDLILSENGL
ncbi:uncharacterized protein LOC115308080 [Manacus vitellinus]|uniref:uncharacterized protein LOC115308080 n=1 Tax=Manacus vitellinus TaxID=328815 RepID=UPI00115E61F6|nr:uncharacterized protein LOC115308080 [Manacus vitellinus]